MFFIETNQRAQIILGTETGNLRVFTVSVKSIRDLFLSTKIVIIEIK